MQRTVRGKQRRPDIAWFLFDQDRQLARLRDELAAGTWSPAPPTPLIVRDPKPRLIARATVRDRVAGNAIAMVLEPLWLRMASDADFACRPGHGTHHGVLRLLHYLQRHRFVLHLDVRSYFPSIRPDLLLEQVCPRVRDAPLRELLTRIVHRGAGSYDAPWIRRLMRFDADWPPPGRGLPMGSVTSQFFAAHVFLQSTDHWLQRELRVPGYVRYVDDLFVFGDRRQDLERWRAAIVERLRVVLDLRLKHPDAPVLACNGHLDALGYRLRRTHIEPLPKAWRRLRRRLADWVWGRGTVRTEAQLRQSLAGTMGHIGFG